MNTLIQQIERIFRVCDGAIIRTTQEAFEGEDVTICIFTLMKEDTNEKMCVLEMVVRLSTCFITNIYTYESHRHTYLASLLILYGMSSVYPGVKRVQLDDMSDNSCFPLKNIFCQLGFQSIEPPDVDPENPERVLLKGPEKELLLTEILLLEKATNIVHKKCTAMFDNSSARLFNFRSTCV